MRLKISDGLIAGVVVLAALWIGGCASPPPPPPPKPQSYVLLLENPDGSTGAVSVSGPRGQVTVDRARHGLNLDGDSAAYPVAQEKIQQDFGAALAARPPLPVTFLLYFETGGAQLTPESRALISRVLEAVRDRPAPDVSVIGHTDNTGSADINEKLGLERAQLVARSIQDSGLKAHDVTVTSHGDRNLLVPTPPNTAEPRNRRVEITIR